MNKFVRIMIAGIAGTLIIDGIYGIGKCIYDKGQADAYTNVTNDLRKIIEPHKES